MGKAIIMSKSGGLVEAVGKNCAVIVDKDAKFVNNLESSIIDLYSNVVLRKKLGERSFQWLADNPKFWKENYYRNFYNLYK